MTDDDTLAVVCLIALIFIVGEAVAVFNPALTTEVIKGWVVCLALLVALMCFLTLPEDQ